jgi:RecA-family ATPase
MFTSATPSDTNPSPNITDIQQHVAQLQQRVVANENKAFYDSTEEVNDLLTIKPANVWLKGASQKPSLKKLIGDLWVENELCILFADTNVGKSILAVQIANAISKQCRFLCFPQTEINDCRVLYIDFEMTDRQFYSRYSDKETQSIYSFSDNFIRAEINPDAINFDEDNLERQINKAIEQAIVSTGANVLIVDNITYLSVENEKSKNALPLMKHLKKLKGALGLSIMVLAHTPKRDSTKPLTRNDLNGSRTLMNFCDSSFAIGESQQENKQRYIKQIKIREGELLYDINNVLLCEIKKENALLQFQFIDFAEETEHLKHLSESEKSEKTAWVLELHQHGMSQRQIAEETRLPLSTVNRYIKKSCTSETQ